MNQYFGKNDATENPFAHVLDQHVSTWADANFHTVFIDNAFNDLNVAPFSASLGASIRPPVIQKVKDDGLGSEGIYLYAFEEGKQQEIFFTCQLPHTYKEYTDLMPHCHIMIPTVQANTFVDFGLEYTFCNVNDVMEANSVIQSNLLASPTIAYKHSIHSLGTISGVGKKISAILTCRLFRKNVAANSYTGNVFLLSVDFHHQIDAFGSRQEFIK